MESPEIQVESVAEPTSSPGDVPWGVFVALAVLLVCYVLQYVGVVVGSIVAWLRDGGPGQAEFEVWHAGLSPDARLTLIGWTAIVGAAITASVLALLLATQGRGRSWTQLLQLREPKGRWVWQSMFCLGAGLFAYVGLHMAQTTYSEVYNYTPALQDAVVLVSEGRSPTAMVMMLFTLVVLAPVFEEILFRCVLYLPLRRELGVVPAALVVGVMFSGLHDYIWGAMHLLVLSLIFTALLERTKSLWPAILAHALNNAITFFLILFGVV